MNALDKSAEPLLIKQIKAALPQVKSSRAKLHVSVAREPVWEKSPLGDEVLVRWLCWSLDDENGEVVAPTFEVLSKDVTEQQLARELPSFFPGVEVVVDHDIEV